MARKEADREDLLREATALVERAELHLVGEVEPIVVGFRRDGAASFFLGADLVYQFNASGALRRAYRGGIMFKAQAGRLVSLTRRRTAKEVQLISRELDEVATAELLRELQTELTSLHHALAARQFQLVGQVPPDTDIVGRVAIMLEPLLAAPIRLAANPRLSPNKDRPG